MEFSNNRKEKKKKKKTNKGRNIGALNAGVSNRL